MQEARFTELSAKTIELYQKQIELVDRVWSYFSQYSAIMLIISITLPFLPLQQDRSATRYLLLIPNAAYFVFVVGNHRILRLMLGELHVMRGIAVAHSGLELTGVDMVVQRRFHIGMSVLIIFLYSLAWYVWS